MVIRNPRATEIDVNSHEYDAFKRLANLRRYGSRLKKVLAKRAVGMHVKPSTALHWLRQNIQIKD